MMLGTHAGCNQSSVEKGCIISVVARTSPRSGATSGVVASLHGRPRMSARFRGRHAGYTRGPPYG